MTARKTKLNMIVSARTAVPGLELKKAVRYYLRRVGLTYDRATRSWCGVCSKEKATSVQADISKKYNSKVLKVKLISL